MWTSDNGHFEKYSGNWKYALSSVCRGMLISMVDSGLWMIEFCALMYCFCHPEGSIPTRTEFVLEGNYTFDAEFKYGIVTRTEGNGVVIFGKNVGEYRLVEIRSKSLVPGFRVIEKGDAPPTTKLVTYSQLIANLNDYPEGMVVRFYLDNKLVFVQRDAMRDAEFFETTQRHIKAREGWMGFFEAARLTRSIPTLEEIAPEEIQADSDEGSIYDDDL